MILPTDFRDNHATGFHGGNFFLREAAGRIRIGTGLADHTAAGAEWQKFRIKGAELFQEQMKMFLVTVLHFYHSLYNSLHILLKHQMINITILKFRTGCQLKQFRSGSKRLSIYKFPAVQGTTLCSFSGGVSDGFYPVKKHGWDHTDPACRSRIHIISKSTGSVQQGKTFPDDYGCLSVLWKK